MTVSGSFQNPTISALDAFVKQDPTQERILLKLVHDNGKAGLRAVPYSELSFRERLSLIFFPGEYKLKRIVVFLESDGFKIPSDSKELEVLKKAGKILNTKVNSHNNKLLTKLFHDTIFRTYDSFETAFKVKLKKETIALQLRTWLEHPADEKTLQDIVKHFEGVKNDPLIGKLYEQAQTKLQKSASPPPEETPHAEPVKGKGIYNPSTSCYLNATLQALRFCPPFREHLQKQAAHLPKNEMQALLESFQSGVTIFETGFANALENALQEGKESEIDALLENHPLNLQFSNEKKTELLTYLLTCIYDRLEGTESGTPQEIDRETIQTLRALIINLGFGNENTDLNTQEDAAEVCQFLLDRLHVSQFSYLTQREYDKSRIPCRVASLEPQMGLKESIAYLEVPNKKTTLATLLFKNPVQETLIRKELLGTDGITEAEKAEVKKLPEKITLDTTATFVFSKEAEPPKWLPVCLRRYEFSLSGTKKKTTDIEPTEILEIPIEGKTEKARFRLHAVTVHAGTSPKSGHYYSYVARETIDGTPGWIEYNDRRVTEHTKSGPMQDILQNGYIFMYQRIE